MKRILWSTLSLLLLAGMGYSIFGLVTRDSPTIPRPPDRKLAGRVLVAPAGSPEAGADFKDPMVAALAVGASAGGSDLADIIGGNGVVEPDSEETKVASEVPGRIAKVLVAEGDKVTAGTPLIALEDASERAALASAEADVEAARARRDKVLKGNRVEDVRAAIAEARAAQTRAGLSRGIYDRTLRLSEGGAATPDELDRAKRQSEADAFSANAADAKKAASVNGSRAEDVAVAEADVRISEARLVEAQARLDQRQVRAPIAGEVLQVKVRAGEHLEPAGEASVVIGDTRRLTVRVDVDERDFAKVAVGAPVKVSAKAFGDKVFKGTVRSLGRRMGRKNQRTDDPTERNDTKILEVVVALDDFAGLVIGQRVVALIAVPGATDSRKEK